MKKLFFLPFALIFSLFFVGCGAPVTKEEEKTPPEEQQTEVSSEQEYSPEVGKFGGELILRVGADPKSFNPITAQDNITATVVSSIFEGLTKINPLTTKPEPLLAEKWVHSEDGKIWTFFLRNDVKWSDGEPFTADDVLFTYRDVIFNPDIPSSIADILTIEGETFTLEKIDDYTVKFTLPSPYAPFLTGMTQGILPEHKWKSSVENGTFSEQMALNMDFSDLVGTGPFSITTYSPGENIVLTRNPHYWQKNENGESLPYLDSLRYRIVSSDDTALLQFQNKELDAYTVRGTDYPLLKAQEQEKDFSLFNLGPTFTKNFLVFNLNTGERNGENFIDPKKRVVFENKVFRQAISYAIDRESIIKIVLNGFGQPQWGPTTESTGYFYNPDVSKYPYNPEKSKQLLQSIGYEDRDKDGVLENEEGEELSFSLITNGDNTERVQMAEMIRKDLTDIGIHVYFTALDFNNLVTKLTETYQWEAILIGLTGGIEPHSGQNIWNSGSAMHMWDPNQDSAARDWEKTIDTLFTKGVQELNPEKRKVLYDRWQEIASDELPLIYTVVPESLVAVYNTFGNLYPNSYGGVFWNIEQVFFLDNPKDRGGEK